MNILLFLKTETNNISLHFGLMTLKDVDPHHKGSHPKMACRQIGNISIGTPHTRKSLVKGERFIRLCVESLSIQTGSLRGITLTGTNKPLWNCPNYWLAMLEKGKTHGKRRNNRQKEFEPQAAFIGCSERRAKPEIQSDQIHTS